MASFIDAMVPHVEIEPALGLKTRRDAIVALRAVKRSILGLRPLPQTETRPS